MGRGPEVGGAWGLNWEGGPALVSASCPQPEGAGQHALPRPGPGRAGPGTQTSKAPGCASRSQAGWSLEGLDKLVPRARAPSPSPTPLGHCQWGLPRDLSVGGCHLPGCCEAARRCQTTPLKEHTHGSSSLDVSERSWGPAACPQEVPRVCPDVAPALTPDTHTQAPRGQAARQIAAPEGLGLTRRPSPMDRT